MNVLELKIPPPLVLILASVLVKVTQGLIGITILPTTVSEIIALLLMLSALILGFSSALSFRRHHTTINPHTPGKTSSLVTSGVFKLTRNPMYLSLSFMLAAWAIYLGSLFGLIWLGVFMAYITAYQIIPEERILEEKFGSEYRHYKEAVRRWI